MGKLLIIEDLVSRIELKADLREWARGEVEKHKATRESQAAEGVEDQKPLRSQPDASNGHVSPYEGSQPFRTLPNQKIDPELSQRAKIVILSDVSGNPSEAYHWAHFGRVMTERRAELRMPYINTLEPSLEEITRNEEIARKNLL